MEKSTGDLKSIRKAEKDLYLKLLTSVSHGRVILCHLEHIRKLNGFFKENDSNWETLFSNAVNSTSSIVQLQISDLNEILKIHMLRNPTAYLPEKLLEIDDYKVALEAMLMETRALVIKPKDPNEHLITLSSFHPQRNIDFKD